MHKHCRLRRSEIGRAACATEVSDGVKTAAGGGEDKMVAAIVAAVLAGAAVILVGGYNVAASDPTPI